LSNRMSDSDNDDDYCPTARDEKAFAHEVGAGKEEESREKVMTEMESREADEILKSFKLNLPIETPEKKKSTVSEVKSYDFAGETVQIDEKTGLEHRFVNCLKSTFKLRKLLLNRIKKNTVRTES